jgi:hypothetical protein
MAAAAALLTMYRLIFAIARSLKWMAVGLFYSNAAINATQRYRCIFPTRRAIVN